jgi:hypothetical protein
MWRQPAELRAGFTDHPVADFIDDHVSPIGQAELSIAEIANRNSDRQPVGNNFGECGVGHRCCPHSTGYQQVGSLTGTSGGQCGQLEHQ